MSFSMVWALCAFLLGDGRGTAQRLLEAACRAQQQGARLVLAPEWALSGGLPGDVLRRDDFMQECTRALQELAQELVQQAPDVTLVLGHPSSDVSGAQRRSAASVVQNGIGITYVRPTLADADAPQGGERRWLQPASVPAWVFEVAGVRFAVFIDVDAGAAALEAQAQQAAAAGAQVLAVLSGVPFDEEQPAAQRVRLAAAARAAGLPLVAVNAVGAHDEDIFSGGSLALDAAGNVCARAPQFEETLWTLRVNAEAGGVQLAGENAPEYEGDEALWRALVLALRSYVQANGFKEAALGLSGGIDSALVLALAVDALGAENVRVLTLPSPYTASMSVEDAQEMARRLGVRCDALSITPTFDALRATLAPLFAGREEDTTEENLQARVRGVLLMALSNKTGCLLLTCGNKSEYATGYCTLYGDMCGGFAPIKDVLKTRVFALARWRNAHDLFGRGAAPIPERIITRPPSAELRPNQTDQDSLPPYELLDAIISRALAGASRAQLLDAFDAAAVQRTLHLLRVGEYKRQQGAVGPRVSRRSFGRDRHMPISHAFQF
ncbi:MAG: NAD+ synthase [Ottowia sp.]|nr:NAD+ synthase [Ottowia sp.]